MSTHHITIILASVLLSTAAAASPRPPTPAQWKDIRELQNAFLQCGGTDADEWYDQNIKDACARSRKLQEKLGRQGFCFYKRILAGRPGKDGCEPLAH